jgi:quinol-cytochrome oxidoreductase complex cytochrome b subunit
MVGWYLALGLLAALAALFPWELGKKADPFASAPEGIKPEWYFLFMFQALKLIPGEVGPFEGEVLGVLVFGVCGLVVLLVPFLDRGQTSRAILNSLAFAAVVFFIVMTAWGRFSGPDEGSLRFILGLVLVVIVLPLLLPFTRPKTGRRQVVYGCLGVACLALFATTWWEFLI